MRNAYGTGRQPTVAQFNNDVEQEIDKLVGPVVTARNKEAGKPDLDALREGRGVTMKSEMSSEEIQSLRRSVEQTAIDNVKRRYSMSGTPVPERVTPTRFRFNLATGTLEPIE